MPFFTSKNMLPFSGCKNPSLVWSNKGIIFRILKNHRKSELFRGSVVWMKTVWFFGLEKCSHFYFLNSLVKKLASFAGIFLDSFNLKLMGMPLNLSGILYCKASSNLTSATNETFFISAFGSISIK